MDRISTHSAYLHAIEAMSDRQAQMSKLQTQLATGRKVLSPSDDPVSAAQAEVARSSVQRIEAEKRMVGFAQIMLQQAEGALGNGTEVLASVRDLAIQGGNATLSAGDRAMLATQIRGMRDELLAVANRRDGSGGYVFGGAGMRSQPFVENAGVVAYAGSAATQQVGTEMPFSTAMDGRALFVTPAGTGAGESIFARLDALVALYEDPAAASTDLVNITKATIDAIDATADAMNAGRAYAGEQLRAIDSITSALDAGQDDAQARLSQLVDLDFAQAISDFASLQTGLDAAMKTYAQVSRLSLFNYIG